MQKQKPLICCFTGNRPQKIAWLGERGHPLYKKLVKVLTRFIKDLIEEDGYRHFICGMALGADTICAETVLNLKYTYPDIIFECALPCPNQDKLWNKRDKRTYQKILEKADIINYISDKYDSGCMFKRNRYMVDKSDLVVAIYDGDTGGGTHYTVSYAYKKGKQVYDGIYYSVAIG